MQGNAGTYIDEMWEAWRRDPQSVHVSWAAFFGGLAKGQSTSQAFSTPPTDGVAHPPPQLSEKEISDHLKVSKLVRAYRIRGHLKADLDPLRIVKPKEGISELDPAYYGFGEEDMEREFLLGEGVLPNFLTPQSKRMTLRRIIEVLSGLYCQKIGFEYMHIPDAKRCDWLRARIETPVIEELSREERQILYSRLSWASHLETFLMTKFPSDKRFGLEGGESLIPGMIDILYKVHGAGAKNVVLGMAHRGRINVLTNVVRKPFESIMAEFNGIRDKGETGSGDVKYHLGLQFTKKMADKGFLDISLLANPSHLEAVDPVVMGKSRGLQFLANDLERFDSTVPILIHGDASFSGQGVVYETLGLAGLPNYRVGGTIHLIVNNQIGFTTDPRFARSTPYCSDLAKSLDAPIFHVNGDDPEAVIRACRLAADWRITHKTDVVVDVVCYRRHGHNEIDQPSFTQPRMYKAIAAQKPVLHLYREALLAQGHITQEYVAEIDKKIFDHFETHYKLAKTYEPKAKEWVSSEWQGIKSAKELRDTYCPPRSTGVDEAALAEIGSKASTLPEGFTPHPGIKKIMETRLKTITTGKDIDMPTAEALAFGSLLTEGHHVRLSGQVSHG